MAELELNKIVGMIMENPELVEKIKEMGKSQEKSDEDASHDTESYTVPKADTAAYVPKVSKRNELLRALQSFLSEDRRKGLETIMTIADVLDTVKKK